MVGDAAQSSLSTLHSRQGSTSTDESLRHIETRREEEGEGGERLGRFELDVSFPEESVESDLLPSSVKISSRSRAELQRIEPKPYHLK